MDQRDYYSSMSAFDANNPSHIEPVDPETEGALQQSVSIKKLGKLGFPLEIIHQIVESMCDRYEQSGIHILSVILRDLVNAAFASPDFLVALPHAYKYLGSKPETQRLIPGTLIWIISLKFNEYIAYILESVGVKYPSAPLNLFMILESERRRGYSSSRGILRGSELLGYSGGRSYIKICQILSARFTNWKAFRDECERVQFEHIGCQEEGCRNMRASKCSLKMCKACCIGPCERHHPTAEWNPIRLNDLQMQSRWNNANAF